MEYDKLQLGYLVRQEGQERPELSAPADDRKRELRKGQEKARREMLRDIGIQ